MSSTQMRSEHATQQLEVVVIPVSDVDRAKRFYGGLGWRLEADFATGEDFRVVQLTPPGSQCSIIFGKGVTAPVPGSVQDLMLIVSDIEAARAELIGRGVDVSAVFHDEGGVFHHAGTRDACRARTRKVALTAHGPRSAIRTATAGCSRRSRRGFPVGCDRARLREDSSWTSRLWQSFCERQRSAMANTKRPLRSTTGRGGTPPTSSRASTGGLPRRQPKMLRSTWNVPADEVAALRAYHGDGHRHGPLEESWANRNCWGKP